MTKRPVRNLAASVHQRLLNRARETGRPFNEVLIRFAMERFLYRLSVSSYGDKFVLKGALMLAAWRSSLSRPTMDIDLLGRMSNDIDPVVRAIQEICRADVPADGLVFHPDSVEASRITEDADYEGIRVRFRGELGNARVVMQIDVGFGDIISPAARKVEYPTILDFPAPRLRGYSRESTVAEKFEAMVRLGELNSRMKDFYDVWLLSKRFEFKGRTLAGAIVKTFSKRGTRIPPSPVAVSPEFGRDATKLAQWDAFVRRSGLADAPKEFCEVVAALGAFLGPVIRILASGGQRMKDEWPAGGPWRG